MNPADYPHAFTVSLSQTPAPMLSSVLQQHGTEIRILAPAGDKLLCFASDAGKAALVAMGLGETFEQNLDGSVPG